jgi:putative hydrolase of HD superfamily
VKYEGLIDFLILAGKLKQIQRTGWIKTGITNPESVSDHTFRVSLIAMILSDLKRLDTEKVLKMSLIHDLPESILGDLTPSQKKEDHRQLENQEMKKILSLLHPDLEYEYSKLWYEFQEMTSSEAELIYAADKLEMLLQAFEYSEKEIDPNRIEQFLDTKIPKNYRGLYNLIINRYKNP